MYGTDFFLNRMTAYIFVCILNLSSFFFHHFCLLLNNTDVIIAMIVSTSYNDDFPFGPVSVISVKHFR